MRSAVVAIACAGSVGCAVPSEPPSAPQRVFIAYPEVGGLLVHVDLGTPGSGVGYDMHFAASGVKLPDSLSITGRLTEEVLGGVAQCPYEQLVGTAVYPVATATGGEPGTSEIIVDHDGPAVARVRVVYEVPYQCGMQQALKGETTFAFYPSGRIVRHDIARPQTAEFSVAAGCGCNGGASGPQDIYFTSFWTFKTNQIVGRDGTPLTGGENVPALCARGLAHMVALAWQPGPTRLQRTSEWASVYDWAIDAALPNVERTVTSAIQIGLDDAPAACDAVHQGLVDAPIRIGSDQLETNELGFYSDDKPRIYPFVITVDEPIPAFAARFNLGSTTHVSVTRDPPLPPGWYTIQPESSVANKLFWFDGGLSRGETITIKPL